MKSGMPEGWGQNMSGPPEPAASAALSFCVVAAPGISTVTSTFGWALLYSTTASSIAFVTSCQEMSVFRAAAAAGACDAGVAPDLAGGASDLAGGASPFDADAAVGP